MNIILFLLVAGAIFVVGTDGRHTATGVSLEKDSQLHRGMFLSVILSRL